MAFVKLDCGILNSTLWDDRDAREVFITALLMAIPHEVTEAVPQIEVRSLDLTGWKVPSGWYGFVHAAGVGIVRQAGMEREVGLGALERLGQPEPDSRTPDFGGRRLVRVDGGFLVLNFIRYRERDHTAAERSKRYRERKASRVASVTPRVASRSVTQAEAEAEADAEVKKKDTVAPTALVTEITNLPVRTSTHALDAALTEVGTRAQARTDADQIRTVQARLLFAYWQAHLHHESSLLDPKRLTRLKSRLAENKGDVHELLFAIDGALRDTNLMGQNERNRKYDGIETIYRDRGQVERLSELGGYKPGRIHSMAEKYLSESSDG